MNGTGSKSTTNCAYYPPSVAAGTPAMLLHLYSTRGVAQREAGVQYCRIMADEPASGGGPLPLVKTEADLLPLALEAAARAGDPNPELIQHVRGTREEVTKTTGSWVYSDEPSYLVAIRGEFTRRRPFPPGPTWDHRRNEFESYSVKVLIVEIESGRITDTSGGPTYPDLSGFDAVLTDHRRCSYPTESSGVSQSWPNVPGTTLGSNW